jgi:hypothetical protein
MKAAAPILLALMACSPVIENNGTRVYAKHWEPVEREINVRARIDLQCPIVEVLLLSRQGKLPVSVSAEGCGRTAIYQRLLRRHHGHYTSKNSVWELMSASPVPPSPVVTNPYSAPSPAEAEPAPDPGPPTTKL